MIRRRFWFFIFFLFGPGPLRADEPGPGAVIYVADGLLYKMPVQGDRRPVVLADIPESLGPIRKISAAADGSAVLVQGAQYAYWIDLTGLAGSEPPLECPRGSRLDPGGGWVMCDTAQGRPVFHHMRSPRQVLALGYEADAATRVSGGAGLVFMRESSVWGLRLDLSGGAGSWKDRFRMATAPQTHLLVSPDGRRAVGHFQHEGSSGLFSFALDGRGALRKIDGPYAEPIGWSLDSRWVLIQDVKRSCVVLATGGEYKCWDGFRVLDIDTAAAHILMLGKLSRDGRSTLHMVPLAGTRPAKPVQIHAGVVTAAWLNDLAKSSQ